MNIEIIKAGSEYLSDCTEALEKSELGRIYFRDPARAMNEGISKKEVFVAVNKEGTCLGFIWYILEGAFHNFPYLHIIAVKEEYRSLGIGKKLLQFFEESVAEDSSKVFLVVADFNPRAKQLYESVGYKEVGVIEGLYKKGITEHLMMKEI